MTAVLRQRDYLCRVAGLEFSELDIEFEIKRSVRPEPNSCQLTVYNLSEASRKQIEELNLYDPKKVKGGAKKPSAKRPVKQNVRAPKVGRIRVELEAGYKEAGRSLIFRGDLRRAITKHDGTTATTVIEGEDGGRSVLSSRINESFPPGTTREHVVRVCAEAMGVGVGNIRDVSALLQTKYSHGTVLSGQASAELKGVLRGAGVVYSIQNGVLVFRAAANGLDREAFVLNSDTGLVGSPELDASGALMVTSLLIPELVPESYIKLESKERQGVYRIIGVTYKGNLAGQDWYAVCECVPG